MLPTIAWLPQKFKEAKNLIHAFDLQFFLIPMKEIYVHTLFQNFKKIHQKLTLL